MLIAWSVLAIALPTLVIRHPNQTNPCLSHSRPKHIR